MWNIQNISVFGFLVIQKLETLVINKVIIYKQEHRETTYQDLRNLHLQLSVVGYFHHTNNACINKMLINNVKQGNSTLRNNFRSQTNASSNLKTWNPSINVQQNAVHKFRRTQSYSSSIKSSLKSSSFHFKKRQTYLSHRSKQCNVMRSSEGTKHQVI